MVILPPIMLVIEQNHLGIPSHDIPVDDEPSFPGKLGLEVYFPEGWWRGGNYNIVAFILLVLTSSDGNTFVVVNNFAHEARAVDFSSSAFYLQGEELGKRLSSVLELLALKSVLDIDQGLETMVLMDIPEEEKEANLISLASEIGSHCCF